MKFSILAIFLLFFSSNLFVCHAQQAISDEQAIKSLRHFYVYYITQVSKPMRENPKLDSLLKKYSTDNLTKQLKEQSDEDTDFFVNTNGPQIESLKTLTVYKDNKEKDIYVVSWVYLHWGYTKDEIIKIKLRLIKTPTDILIDRIIR